MEVILFMKVKFGLLPRLIVGIIIGIVLGLWGNIFIMTVYATFNALFGQFLIFSIPLIIIGFIIPGISEMGGKAGKMAGVVVAFSYFLTVVGGFIAFYAVILFSDFILGTVGILQEERAPIQSVIPLTIPPIMPTMTALAFAFVVGIFMTTIKGNNVFRQIASNFQHIVKQVIHKIIVPLLPLHISGLFASLAFQGQVFDLMVTFFRLFVVVLALHLLFLFVLYTIAGIIYKVNPFKIMKIMIPTYITALGTQSSLATMPVNMVNVRKIGIDRNVADFVVPFGATILLPGSTMSIVACAVVVMFMFGMEISIAALAPFIFGLAVTMVAAPGVPGGAIIAALGMLEITLGFSEEMMTLMIALYFAQDSFGTAANISSDGAVAMYLNKLSGFHKLNDVSDEETQENIKTEA